MLGLEPKRRKPRSPSARFPRLSDDVGYGDPSQNRTVTDQMRSSIAARGTERTRLMHASGSMAVINPGNVRDGAGRRWRAAPCTGWCSLQRATGCSGRLG